MKIRDFNHFMEIITTLEEGGMTELPDVEIKCHIAWDERDISLLQEVLDDYPGIYEEALRNIEEKKYWEEKEPFRPHPDSEEANSIKGPIHLGFTNGHPVGFDPLDFLRGWFFCGETGSGKTYPVLRICDQLLGIPREDRNFNLLIIQALKRDADFLIKRHNNLKVIEWKDFRRAMLQVENWDTPMDKINSFCGVFSTVNWLMLHSQPLFKRAVVRCCEKNKVFDGSELYPTFSGIFKEIDRAAKDFDLDGYEHRNVRDHIKFVVSSIVETNEILDCRCGLTVQDFFSQEDVILNVMGEDNDYIIGTIVADILSDLRRFYEKSPLHPPKLRTLIVVDECRRIFPTGSEDSKSVHKSNSKMERFVTTRRSSGIGLIAITQEPQSSPDWLTNNSAYVLSFPIGGTGRKQVEQLLNLTKEQSKFIDELPPWTGIFRDRRFNRRYLVDIPGDLEVVPITEAETDDIMRPFIRQFHNELKAKNQASEEILRQLQNQGQKAYTERDLEKVHQIIFPETLQVLKLIQEDVYTNKTALLKKSGVSRNKFYASINWLKDNDFITETHCRTSKKRWADFYPVTEKGHDLLKAPKSERIPSVKRFKHTYYCKKVEEWHKSHGYNATREYGPKEMPIVTRTTESGKVIQLPQRIDVFAVIDGTKTAYEITLSFSNLELNLYKCLVMMKMDQVQIVYENSAGKDRAEKTVAQSKMPDDLKSRIKFISIGDFL